MSITLRIISIALLGTLAACGGDEPATTDGSSGAQKPVVTGHTLAADIPDAVGIKAALEMEPGATVAVFGRVQEVSPGGMAVFHLVDDTIAYCGRGEEECGCTTPWDYCCEAHEMQAARISVELRDANGKVVKAKDLDLRLLDLVAVRGKLNKTEEGGLFLVAEDGWFRRERPELPEGVEWPY